MAKIYQYPQLGVLLQKAAKQYGNNSFEAAWRTLQQAYQITPKLNHKEALRVHVLELTILLGKHSRLNRRQTEYSQKSATAIANQCKNIANRALHAAQAAGISGSEVADIYGLLGQLYFERQEWDRAKDNFTAARDQTLLDQDIIKRFLGELQYTSELARVEAKQNQVERALSIFRTCQNLIMEYASNLQKYNKLPNKAGLEILKDLKETQIDLLLKCAQVLKEAGHAGGVKEAIFQIKDMAAELPRHERAKIQFQIKQIEQTPK